MSDLYKTAAEFPLSLGRVRGVRSTQELTQELGTRSRVRWAARTGQVERTRRGVYLSGAGGATLYEQMQALLPSLPTGAAFGVHTGAQLHGFGVVASARLHVLVPRGQLVTQLLGVCAHEAALSFEPVDVAGLPCAPPERCAIDLARRVRRLDALPVLDAALFSGACSEDSLRREAARHYRLRGVRQVRELIPLADGRSACRQETQLRLLIRDASLPAPQPQLKVLDEHGYVRCILDLGYERQKVGLEYDGESHLSRERLRSDRARHNWLELRGWTMRYVTDVDIYRRPGDFTNNLRATLRARHHPSLIKGKGSPKQDPTTAASP